MSACATDECSNAATRRIQFRWQIGPNLVPEADYCDDCAYYLETTVGRDVGVATGKPSPSWAEVRCAGPRNGQ